MPFCWMSRALWVQMNGLGLVMYAVLVEDGFKVGRAGEHPALQPLGGDIAKDLFHQVGPRC